MEPFTDAVTTESEGFSVGYNTEGFSEGDSKGEVGLGGRSPDVLITRELMYRACELSLNLNADTALSMKIYERFLKSIESIAASQTESGTTPFAGSPTQPVLQNVMQQKKSTEDTDAAKDDDDDDDDDDDEK